MTAPIPPLSITGGPAVSSTGPVDGGDSGQGGVSKTYNFGANPNTGLAGSITGTLLSAQTLLIVGAVVGGFLWLKYRRR